MFSANMQLKSSLLKELAKEQAKSQPTPFSAPALCSKLVKESLIS